MTDLTDEALDQCLRFVTNVPFDEAGRYISPIRKVALCCLDGMEVEEIATRMRMTPAGVIEIMDRIYLYNRRFNY